METQTGKQNYYDVPAISNSAMSKINPAQGGSLLKYRMWLEEKKERNEMKYFERGRLLHTAILEPELYKVEDIEKPSDNICTIIEMVYAVFGGHSALPDELNMENRDIYSSVFDVVKLSAKEIGYGQKWKEDTIYTKVKDEGSEYLQFLLSASDKLVISKADKLIIDESYFALQKDPNTRQILFQEKQVTEYEIFETYKDVQMKSKLDIYKEEEGVITIREVKSTSMPITLFPISFVKFHYYRQSAVYETMACLEYYRKNNAPPKRVIHEYAVVEMRPPYETMLYMVHPDWITYGKQEMERIVEYYKRNETIFPSTMITLSEAGYPHGTSELLKIRP